VVGGKGGGRGGVVWQVCGVVVVGRCGVAQVWRWQGRARVVWGGGSEAEFCRQRKALPEAPPHALLLKLFCPSLPPPPLEAGGGGHA